MRARRVRGTRAPRRRDCSARPTAAPPGPASPASTSIRSARPGAAATRTARPTARRCTRSWSIRATRSTCTSRCRAAACSSRSTAAPTGSRSIAACAPTSCRSPRPSSATTRIACGFAGGQSRPALPAEPLRALSARPALGRLDGHRRRHAQVGRARSAFRWSSHPRDPDTAWVFPMDGTDVWPRISPGGRPAVYRSLDARQDLEAPGPGLPQIAGVVDGEAAGDDGRCPRSGRAVLRDHVRRGLGQPRRRPHLALPRAKSAAVYAVEATA